MDHCQLASNKSASNKVPITGKTWNITSSYNAVTMEVLKCLAIKSLVGILFEEKERNTVLHNIYVTREVSRNSDCKKYGIGWQLPNVIGSMKRNNERHSVINQQFKQNMKDCLLDSI